MTCPTLSQILPRCQPLTDPHMRRTDRCQTTIYRTPTP
ncbi:hypothetical protein J3A99_005180 [Pseudomonas sp. BP7]|nr:hypothetical protein [Pseudomonas sp. BP7]